MPALSKSGHAPQACKNVPKVSNALLRVPTCFRGQNSDLAGKHSIWQIRYKMTQKVKHLPNIEGNYENNKEKRGQTPITLQFQAIIRNMPLAIFI